MHCPSCGQQQINNESKFCSRCGLPLGVIAEVVSHGGYLPQLVQLAEMQHKKPFFSKKNGVTLGIIWFIFLTMFCTAMLGILNAPEELIGLVAVTGVFGAMMIIVGSLVALPSSKSPTLIANAVPIQPDQLNPATAQAALPPQPAGYYAAPGVGNWRDTNDLQPASVTESTTRLLDKKDSNQ
jgi:hypothetical protein